MLPEDYMKLALRLARRGLGKTSPNPMVGAVIVKDGCIVGQGYHRKFGGKHAEINAIESAGEDIAGATIYVTLEPCSHYGKTPPCVDAIVKNKLDKVIIGTLDPNPEVSGKGVEILNRYGIKTEVRMLEEECRALNPAHFKYMSTGLPLITLKFAQTIDGRIATATGESRWISSPSSRRFAHKLRAVNDAVLVGAGTVLKDNPELTVRLVRGRNPLRIVLDSRLRIPLDARLLKNQREARTLIATTDAADKAKIKALYQMGIETLVTGQDAQGKIDILQLLKTLAQRNISSVLVEGGAETITSFLRLGLADKLVIFIAPKILGKGTEAIGELDITDIGRALPLRFHKTYRLGGDLVIEAEIERS